MQTSPVSSNAYIVIILHIYVFTGFTTKVRVKKDEDMELGTKNRLDDSIVEFKHSRMYQDKF